MTIQKTAAERLKQAASRSDLDYQKGFEDGERSALARLSPQIEKLAAASIEEFQERMEKQSHASAALRGQVAVHSMIARLERYKQSMAEGLCWKCGVRPSRPAHRYALCTHCDPN